MANTVLVEKEITLQQKIDAKNAAPTVWSTDKKDWVYLSIPEENPLGEKHDTMGLNTHYFEAGQTYLVPQEVANTIKERLKAYNHSCIRLLQTKHDYEAEKAVNTYGTRAGQALSPDQVKEL